MRVLDVGDDGVADYGDGKGEEHYCAAEAEAVGNECYEDCRLLDVRCYGKIEIGREGGREGMVTCDYGCDGVGDDGP
jgi:hypothetical protein